MIPSTERSDPVNPQPQPQASSAFPKDPFVDSLPAGQTFETQALTQLRPNGRSRSRPNLSVSTDNTTFTPDNLPMIVQTPASDDSPMPVPPKPWLEQPVKATQPKAAAIPLPLYYGYERPPPGLAVAPQPQPAQASVSSQYLKPPSLLPTRLQQQQARIDPDTSTPVTRLMTTMHARKSSQAVDPFVTPFDDEHRVAPTTQQMPMSRYSMYAARNPFADPAASPRRPESNPFATAIAV